MAQEQSGRSPIHRSWSDLPKEEVYPGIFRQIVDGSQQTMVRYRYEPESVFPIHAHPQEQVTVVVSGTIEFTVGDDRITMTAGEVAVIPAELPHGARVIGSEPVETFNALSPRREQSPGPSQGEPQS
jgi:quercetin dioxygenase-like cupin family protein